MTYSQASLIRINRQRFASHIHSDWSSELLLRNLVKTSCSDSIKAVSNHSSKVILRDLHTESSRALTFSSTGKAMYNMITPICFWLVNYFLHWFFISCQIPPFNHQIIEKDAYSSVIHRRQINIGFHPTSRQLGLLNCMESIQYSNSNSQGRRTSNRLVFVKPEWAVGPVTFPI